MPINGSDTTVEDIKRWQKHYTETLYGSVRSEQEIDQSYRDDTFLVPEIKSPAVLTRSGLGARMVDSPAEQIITDNPQAFINVIKGGNESGQRIGKVINQMWIPYMKRMSPNPVKEYLKNLLLRGEAYIQILHNKLWLEKEGANIGLPVFFLIPDPMVIYGSPEEYENGIPDRVVVWYRRHYEDVIIKYPKWTDPKHRASSEDKFVEWLEYWEKGIRYFEADGEFVLEGEVQPNVYGFVPFIRKRSGFGRTAPNGDLSKLIVSDLKMARDLLRAECAIRTDIDSILHLYAHKRIDVFDPEGTLKFDELVDKYDMSAGSMNYIPGLSPENLKEGVTMLPSAEAFNYYSSIRAEINIRSPFIGAGFPLGSSGRQDDIAASSAMRRYDTVLENTEVAFATAYEKAFVVMKESGVELPVGLQKTDLDTDFIASVRFKASDPAEEDRLSTLGDRLWARGNGSIDLRTNLIDYQGKTSDQAEDIIAASLVDKLTIFNPDVAAVMGMVFAEESGMGEFIKQAQERTAQMQQTRGALQDQAPPSTEERIAGEAQTQTGMDMIDMSLANKGARRPPEGR